MNKRATTILLLCALLTGCTSCGGESPAETTTANTTTAPTETTSPYADNLPDDLNFGGETVTFLYRDEIADEFFTDESNGDIVNDTLYESIRSVEERLNVYIETVRREGHLTSVRQEYMDHITSSVLAGDDTYDWVDLMIGNSTVMMRNGIFLDLTQNKYMDFDQPWYLKGLTETVTVDNKLFFASGDVSIGYLKNSFCIYFNHDLAETYQLENLYTLVDNGQWTLDKVMELAAIASQDLNADGKYDSADNIGFMIHDYTHLYGFMGSTQISFFEKNESGEWEYVLGSQRDSDICDKLYTLLNESTGIFYDPDITNAIPERIDSYNSLTTQFTSGNVLMITAQMDDAVSLLRNMKDSYGVLPFPKLDEDQENYQSSSRSTHNAFSMPVTCGDPDMAGAVYEALGASNYTKLLPAYFEVAMKTKYSNDDDSARMFDIIHDSFVLDFGYMFNNALSDPVRPYWQALHSEGSFASTLASKQSAVNAALEEYMADIAENCQ
ncbi:MAG: hypothetical protein IJ493_12750 [Clostridia bacterium]|nr:hypothetical protein [Clostridia bacterium]